MTSENGGGWGFKQIVTLIGMAIFVVATIARLIIAWRAPSDAEVQARMQENLRNWQANNARPGESTGPRIPLDPLPPAQKTERKEFINRFLKAIRSGDLNDAYAMTSASYREKVSLEAFTRLIEKYPGIKHEDQCDVWVDVSLPSGSMTMNVSGPGNGKATTVVNMAVSAVSTAERWLVSRFTVKTVEEQKAAANKPEPNSQERPRPPVDPKQVEKDIKEGKEFVEQFLSAIRNGNDFFAYEMTSGGYRFLRSRNDFKSFCELATRGDVDQCHVSATLSYPGGDTSVVIAGPPQPDLAKTVIEIGAAKESVFSWKVNSFRWHSNQKEEQHISGRRQSLQR